MKRANKILAVVLTIIMAVGILPMAQIAELDSSGLFVNVFAADGDNNDSFGNELTWELNADGSKTSQSVNYGDTIYLTLGFNTAYGLQAANFVLNYNSNVIEFVEFNSAQQDCFDGTIINGEPGEGEYTFGLLYLDLGDRDRYYPKNRLELGTLTFKVIGSPTETCELRFGPTSISGVYNPYAAQSKTVITVSDDNCENGLLYDGDCLLKANKTLEGECFIKKGTTRISDRAFYDCTSLTSVTIPDGVTSIGEKAFYNCTSLTSVTIPESVTNIGSLSFGYCKALEEVSLPAKVKLGGMCFMECPVADESNREDGVLYIDTCLISANKNVPDRYSIKAGTTSINSYAFHSADNMTSVIIPESVMSIGEDAFSNKNIENICYTGSREQWSSIEGTDGIDINKVRYMRSIYNQPGEEKEETELTLTPEGELRISGNGPMYDFYYDHIPCNIFIDGISVTIGSGITKFFGPSNPDIKVKSFSVDNGNPVYKSGDNGELLSADGSILCAYPSAEESETYTVSSSVNSIAWFAFRNCSNLHSIVLPDTVTSIGEKAFDGCTQLSSVNIPLGLTQMGENPFRGTIIESDPANWENGVMYLSTVLVEARSGNNMMYPDYDSSLYGTIPENYTIREDTTVIAEYAFNWNEIVKSVTVTDRVTHIPNALFFRCFSLETLTLPDTIATVGEILFMDASLSDIYFKGTEDKFNEITFIDDPDAYLKDYLGDRITVHFISDSKPGDINGDGEVLANDARMVLRASALLETLNDAQTTAADVNKDGKVLADDARQILRYSAQLQKAFITA